MARPRVIEYPEGGKVEIQGFKTERADELQKYILAEKDPLPSKPVNFDELPETAIAVTMNEEGKFCLVKVAFNLKTKEAGVKEVYVGFNRSEIINLFRKEAVDNDFV